MNTAEAIRLYLADCKQRGMTPGAIVGYNSYLRHFADEFPELPTDPAPIERFLKVRKEPPGKRGHVHKALSSFFHFLETAGHVPAGAFPHGQRGRPKKVAPAPKPAPARPISALKGPPSGATADYLPLKIGEGGSFLITITIAVTPDSGAGGAVLRISGATEAPA